MGAEDALRARQHDDDQQAHFTISRQAHQTASDQACYTCASQTAAED